MEVFTNQEGRVACVTDSAKLLSEKVWREIGARELVPIRRRWINGEASKLSSAMLPQIHGGYADEQESDVRGAVF